MVRVPAGRLRRPGDLALRVGPALADLADEQVGEPAGLALDRVGERVEHRAAVLARRPGRLRRRGGPDGLRDRGRVGRRRREHALARERVDRDDLAHGCLRPGTPRP